MNLRPRRPDPPRVDITPLIDVVFLMLIFFMVSTTFDKQTQLKVDLPEAAAEATTEKEPEQIEITVDQAGHFYVNQRELVQHNADTLRRTLMKITDGRSELPVLLHGDQNAPYGAIVTVMDVVGELGMSRLSFVARQPTSDTDN